jgi:hypothetical protein
MTVTWICPTWNRPKCLRELVRQFLAQDYPRERLELLILDDAGQYENQRGDDGQGGHRWQLISFDRPFPTLGDKYNALLSMVTTEAVVIAEDDDLYHPRHTAQHAQVLLDFSASKPSTVNVDHKGLHREPAAGRFHASMAARTDLLRSLGGWPTNRRADFDLQMIAKLQRAFGQFGDPCLIDPEPTYTFTWEGSGHYHAQAYGRGPTDEGWLARARAAAGPVSFIGDLQL